MEEASMNRRSFLSAVAQLLLGGAAAALGPRLAQAGTSNSSRRPILISKQSDVFRRASAQLGPDLAVLSITQRDGQYWLQASYQGLDVYLKSPDGSTWYTADWTPPASRAHRTFITVVGG
jgi:hypothetical protein